MAPAARLLVYIVNNKEIIADAVTFTIEEMYENKVCLTQYFRCDTNSNFPVLLLRWKEVECDQKQ